MITQIKVGFREGEKINYFQFIGRARLAELDEKMAFQGGWDDFEKEGFKILQPKYTIVVPGYESADIVMIANVWNQQKSLPIDKQTSCVVEVYFGSGKMNQVEFPFLLKKNHIVDNVIAWYTPISSHPDGELAPAEAE